MTALISRDQGSKVGADEESSHPGHDTAGTAVGTGGGAARGGERAGQVSRYAIGLSARVVGLSTTADREGRLRRFSTVGVQLPFPIGHVAVHVAWG